MGKELGDFYDPQGLREYEDTKPDWLKGKWGMLSDRDILRCLEEDIIQISPLPADLEKCLNTCKLDFHLGNVFTVFKRAKATTVELDGEIPPDFQEDIVVRDGDFFALHPGETVLAQIKERLTLPSYVVARVEGKSRIARRGVSIQFAALIDAGWDGHPTLEFNNNGIAIGLLRPAQAVGSFSFELLTSPALFPYAKKRTSTFKDQGVPRF